jgi:hypothetical protein
MKVWPELEKTSWYNLHADDSEYDAAYGERYGYTVIDVPSSTLARWQRALAEARSVLSEINAAMAATDDQ